MMLHSFIIINIFLLQESKPVQTKVSLKTFAQIMAEKREKMKREKEQNESSGVSPPRKRIAPLRDSNGNY